MLTGMRQTVLVSLLALLLSGVSAAAGPHPVNRTFFGRLAIKGFDPVAYHVDGKAAKGSKVYTLEWKGATWRFVSAAHKEMFEENPERYAPAYGGYCAWAVSQNDIADIDPEAWAIVDNRLYLNYSRKIQARWENDMENLIRKANANWPELAGLREGE